MLNVEKEAQREIFAVKKILPSRIVPRHYSLVRFQIEAIQKNEPAALSPAPVSQRTAYGVLQTMAPFKLTQHHLEGDGILLLRLGPEKANNGFASAVFVLTKSYCFGPMSISKGPKRWLDEHASRRTCFAV
jgi:hypothetical protein